MANLIGAVWNVKFGVKIYENLLFSDIFNFG